MRTVNITQARAQLSKLIKRAANGQPIVITKAGTPLVKVVPVDAPKAPRRLGLLKGQFKVPDDFDTMGQAEIEKLFGIGQ